MAGGLQRSNRINTLPLELDDNRNLYVTLGTRLDSTNDSVSIGGSVAGGWTKAKIRDLSSTVTAIKAAPGKLGALEVENNQGAAAWIQVFDVAVAGVALGTTTPDKEFLIPANGSLRVNWADVGVDFPTAISIASTTAEKGSTGSAAGVQVFASYK